ncbi:MAG: ArsR family transcriptional regulator, partial [Clostridia bacterium]|nr:ArsR family transcriptional regulator [Clostridia bacterium]
MPERVSCECETIHEDAVREVKAGLSSRDEYIALASLFKMFGDGTRVEILHALELHEMCVCDLAAL